MRRSDANSPAANRPAGAPPQSAHAVQLQRGFPRLTFAAPLEAEFREVHLAEILPQVRRNLWLAIAFVAFAAAAILHLAFPKSSEGAEKHVAWGVVLLSAIFAAAWLTMLRAAGLSLAERPAADALRMLLPALLPLTISVLAPWSYSRVRHL